MTGEVVLDYVIQKSQLDPNTFWGLFEVVCDELLGKGRRVIWLYTHQDISLSSDINFKALKSILRLKNFFPSVSSNMK